MTISPSRLRQALRRSRKRIVLGVVAAWVIALTLRGGVGFVMLMTGAAAVLLWWANATTRPSSGSSGDSSDGDSGWWPSGSGGSGDSGDGGGDGGGGDGGGGD